MDIHIVTAFPDIVAGPIQQSILRQAQIRKLIGFHIYNLRDFTQSKHQQIDDYPYGGGPGMVLKPEPIITCIEAILEKTAGAAPHLVYLTPQGVTFNQQKAQELTRYDHLILLCGHYKGIDERVIEYFTPDEISIGNYVLSSGEIAGLVIIDSIVRLIPGVLNDLDSATTDSFQSEWLDAPHYTRPEVYREMTVPAVLLSGDHAKIKAWRKSKAIERTLRKQQLESRVKATEQD